MIKMAYRPSFEFLVKTNVIHVAAKGGKTTGCGFDVKEYKKLYNLIIQYPKIDKAAFCKKCRAVYHERDEKNYPPVN